MDKACDVNVTDMHSALALLKIMPGQFIETNEPVDLHAEPSGVYRYIGAGGTVKRPTNIEPAMIFNNIKGHQDAKVVIGSFASRERVAEILGAKPERLGFLFNEAVKHCNFRLKMFPFT